MQNSNANFGDMRCCSTKAEPGGGLALYLGREVAQRCAGIVAQVMRHIVPTVILQQHSRTA